jgi:hypothetical protein
MRTTMTRREYCRLECEFLNIWYGQWADCRACQWHNMLLGGNSCDSDD